MHIYMDVWSPSVGDECALEIDEQNIRDQYAIAVKVDGHVVTPKRSFYMVIPRAAFR